jgi:outer membrane protein OmpA-like peptidoglycan-associated protein
MTTTTLKSIAATAALLLAACASTPPAHQGLEQARAAVAAAQSDPHVTRFAPAELDLAARTLNDAERLWREGEGGEFISHRAYIAEQRARIAQQTAMARAAEVELADARQARREQLEARAREAEAARERAEAIAQESQERLLAIELARKAAQSERLAATEELAAGVRRLEAQVPELRAREGQSGWVLTVAGETFFGQGEAIVRPEGRRALDELARVLREHPERNVLIEGFTDEGGGDDLNRRLSTRRANAVRNALVLSGIDAQRIVARGMGNAFPVADARNRMEIVIASEAGGAGIGASR